MRVKFLILALFLNICLAQMSKLELKKQLEQLEAKIRSSETKLQAFDQLKHQVKDQKQNQVVSQEEKSTLQYLSHDDINKIPLFNNINLNTAKLNSGSAVSQDNDQSRSSSDKSANLGTKSEPQSPLLNQIFDKNPYKLSNANSNYRMNGFSVVPVKSFKSQFQTQVQALTLVASSEDVNTEQGQELINNLSAYDKEGNLLAQIQEEFIPVSIAKGTSQQDMIFATLSANNFVNLYRIKMEQQKDDDNKPIQMVQLVKAWSVDLFEVLNQQNELSESDESLQTILMKVIISRQKGSVRVSVLDQKNWLTTLSVKDGKFESRISIGDAKKPITSVISHQMSMMLLSQDRIDFFRHMDGKTRDFHCSDKTLSEPIQTDDQFVSFAIEQSVPTVLYAASPKAISIFTIKGKDAPECSLEGKIPISDLSSKTIQQVTTTGQVLFVYLSDGSFEVFKLNGKSALEFVKQVETKPNESRALYQPAFLKEKRIDFLNQQASLVESYDNYVIIRADLISEENDDSFSSNLVLVQTTFKSKFDGEGSWLNWMIDNAFSVILLGTLLISGTYQVYKMIKDRKKEKETMEKRKQEMMQAARNGNPQYQGANQKRSAPQPQGHNNRFEEEPEEEIIDTRVRPQKNKRTTVNRRQKLSTINEENNSDRNGRQQDEDSDLSEMSEHTKEIKLEEESYDVQLKEIQKQVEGFQDLMGSDLGNMMSQIEDLKKQTDGFKDITDNLTKMTKKEKDQAQDYLEKTGKKVE